MIHGPLPPTRREPSADEKMGMAWWNHMSRPERQAALDAAAAKLGGDPSAADAWATWKASGFIPPLQSHPSCGIADRTPSPGVIHKVPS
jgi:hypothetical protein